MALPTFIVIGAMKCGTSSLHAYLGDHPQVFTSNPKELDFFVESKTWRRGVDWYKSQFEAVPGVLARGESSPNYSKFPVFLGVPARMANVVPEARLVYLVRHPVDRIRSHLLHNSLHRKERRSLATVAFDPQYLACSSYSTQLDQFLEHFPEDQILVVTADALMHDRAASVARILRHIGVDPTILPGNLHQQRHRTKGRSGWWTRLAGEGSPVDLDLNSNQKRLLHERLRPEVAGLRRFLGDTFDGWGIG